MPTVKTKTSPTSKPAASSQYFYGRGSRKRAAAQVRLYRGTGRILINSQAVDEKILPIVAEPLILTGTASQFDVHARVHGGGMTSQPAAVRLAVARALLNFEPPLKPTLRKANLLTRDQREKERKKPGLKRARRAPQWQKR
jgi:small subunit ribosomal protein S9